MPKRFHAPRIDEVEPNGEITDAAPPRPVRARVRYILAVPDEWFTVNAWALAWTRTEVLVYWRTPGVAKGRPVWIPATHVQRRPPP